VEFRSSVHTLLRTERPVPFDVSLDVPEQMERFVTRTNGFDQRVALMTVAVFPGKSRICLTFF
jgi:hypothetical protein